MSEGLYLSSDRWMCFKSESNVKFGVEWVSVGAGEGGGEIVTESIK